MQPTLLANKDPQILRELMKSFSCSPEFVEYLRSSIVSLGGTDSVATLGGTRAVAALFVRGLKHVRDINNPVCAETVERLSVHTNPQTVSMVDRAVSDRSGYLEDCIVFGQWLHAQIEQNVLEPRQGIVSEHKTDYMRLYICAYAMLAGVEIDPKHQHA